MSETSERNMEEQLDNILQDKETKIFQISSDIYNVYGSRYLLAENKGGMDTKALEERYSLILEKYDFLVGDWSYDQLRLRGFFYDDTKDVPIDMRISSLEDYLMEYCSFGCSYFVLKRLDEKTVFPDYSRDASRKRKKRSSKGRYKKSKKSPQSHKNSGRKKENNKDVETKKVQDVESRAKFRIKKKKQEE